MPRSGWMLFVLMIIALPLSAAFLTDVPQELTQPDGTVINCLASGDEFHNWLHDSENYTIIRNSNTGYYSYARKKGRDLEATDYIVGKTNPSTTELQPGLNIDEDLYLQKRQSWWQDTPRISRTPTSGQINNLVVFIRFSDQGDFSAGLSAYDTMFNSNTPNTNSMYNYFMEDSYNALSISTSFYPIPNGNLVLSYQDSNPLNYFMPYSTGNPNGYTNDNDRRTREHTLLANAVQFISNQVPTDLVIDADNDGRVDNVCFIVKGSSGDWANLLWPHMWTLYTYEVLLNGARVFTYNFQLENSLSYSGVGVLCHEMSHSIGMPDLYHYTSNGISPVGRWDLMESNRNPPQHHSAYMKSFYTDWLPPVRQISQSGSYWVNKMGNQQDNCYKIPSNNLQYYYMVEFRKQEGTFENSLSGTGLVVYRVNTAQQGSGNSNGPPDELYAYRPGGTLTANGTVNSAHYSLEVNRTAINESTNPSPFLGDGQLGGLSITQIGSSAGDSINFQVTLPLAPPTDYDEGFESGDFSQYAWSFSGNSDWIINSSEAYEGSFCAKSGAINHNQSSSLILNLNVAADGNIGFLKKVSSEQGYDYLKFYIDDIQQGQFSGNSNWSYVQYPITSGPHVLKWSYIKDQGVVTGSDCAWIDNISFRWEAPETLDIPQDFQALSLSDDIAIHLSWQPPLQTTSVLQGYRIFKNDVQIADLDTIYTAFTDFNVIPNLTYSYYIKAFYSSPHGHSLATDTLSVLVSGIPIVPVLISAEVIDTNSVLLDWVLTFQNRGVIGYHIYRNGALVQTINDVAIQQWTDLNLNPGEYSYQIAAKYPVFSSDLSEPVIVIIQDVVGTSDLISQALVYGISKAYPNPFQEKTQIKYCVDKDNTAIEISIYNLKGQKVRTLNTGNHKSGYFDVYWDGLNAQGKRASAGIYFCRMQSSQQASSQKLLLIK